MPPKKQAAYAGIIKRLDALAPYDGISVVRMTIIFDGKKPVAWNKPTLTKFEPTQTPAEMQSVIDALAGGCE